MPETLGMDLLKLLAVAALVLANGFFVAAEFSLVSVRRTRVNELLAAGRESARTVLHAIDDPDRFIAATQLGITMASLALGWIGEPALAHLLEPLLGWLPGAGSVVASHTLAVALSFFVITFLHVVVGELAPKSIALQYPEETAFRVAGPTILTENLTRPLIWLLNGAGNGVLRLVGLRAPTGHQRAHSVEELKMLIADSEQGGVLDMAEMEMLRRAFDFGERRVNEAMIPRPDVVGMEADATVADLLKVFRQARHSRFPVYEEDLDNVIGVVSIKDVLQALAAGTIAYQRPLRSLAKPTLFVPETKSIASLLAQMRDQRIQLAVVIDEYGGTAGIVTAEELVEEIVGRISDDWVGDADAVAQIDERTVEFDAQLRVDEVNDELGITLPTGDEYETVAGLILYRLQRIPKEGEGLQQGNLRLTVAKMEGPKITRVRIRRAEATAKPAHP
ncbi:MAG: HlyC/CorC family transporter [Chloroflexi bacterium]|nr:HlyC/CorC family transporter [Chloroflexota bacterium]